MEGKVENIIRLHLKRKGWRVQRRSGPQGVDIMGRNVRGRSWYIEVQGNKKPNGARLATTQLYTHLYRAVGQICKRMGEGTYNAFLWKHRRANQGGNSELFEMVNRGEFRLLQPLRYGVDLEPKQLRSRRDCLGKAKRL